MQRTILWMLAVALILPVLCAGTATADDAPITQEAVFFVR